MKLFAVCLSFIQAFHVYNIQKIYTLIQVISIIKITAHTQMYKQPTHTKTPPNFLTNLLKPIIKYNKHSGQIIALGSHPHSHPHPHAHKKQSKTKQPHAYTNNWQLRVYNIQNKQTHTYKLPNIVQQQSIYGYQAICQNMYAIWACGKGKSKLKGKEDKQGRNDRYMQQQSQQQGSVQQQLLVILQVPKNINTYILQASTQQQQHIPQLLVRSITKLQPTSISTLPPSQQQHSPLSPSFPKYHDIHRQLSYIQQLCSLCLHWRYNDKQGGMFANNLAPPPQLNPVPKCLIRVQYIRIKSRQQQIVGDICTYYTALRNVYEYVTVLHPKYIDYQQYYHNIDKINNNNSNVGNVGNANTIGNIENNNNNTNTNNSNNSKMVRNKPLIVVYDSMFPLPNHMLMVEQDRKIKMTVFAMNAYRLVLPNHTYGHRIEVEGYQLGIDGIQVVGNDDNVNNNNDDNNDIKQQNLNKQLQQQPQQQQQQQQVSQQQQLQQQNITQLITHIHQQPTSYTSYTSYPPCTAQQLQSSTQLQMHKQQIQKYTTSTILIIHTVHNKQYKIIRVNVNLYTCNANVISCCKFSRQSRMDVVVDVRHCGDYCGVLVADSQYLCYHGLDNIKNKHKYRQKENSSSDIKNNKKEQKKKKEQQNIMKQQSQQIHQQQQQQQQHLSQSQQSQQYQIIQFKHNYSTKPQKYDQQLSCNKNGSRVHQQKYIMYIYACYQDNNNIVLKINKQSNDHLSHNYILVNLFQLSNYKPQNNRIQMIYDQKGRYRILYISQADQLLQIQQKEEGKYGKGKCKSKKDGKFVDIIELSNKKLIYMKMLEQLYNKNKINIEHQNIGQNQQHIVQIIGKEMLELL